MRIIFNDASSNPACLLKGATVRVGPFAGNQAVGFFLLPNDVCTSTLPTADNGQPGHPENAYWSIDQFNLPKVAAKWKEYPKTGRMVAVVKDNAKNRFHLGFEDKPTTDQDYNDLVFFLESNCRINEVYIPCLGTECPAGTVLNTKRCTCACANPSPCPGILKWDDEKCRCVCPTGAENPCQSTRCATSVCDETSASCKTTPIQCPGQDTSCGRWKCDPSQGCIREELSCPALADKCKQNVCNRQTWECVSKDKERPAWAVDDFCSTWACQAATGQWVETETECPEDTSCETYSCDAQRGKCIKSPVPCAQCPPISCAIYACDPKRGWEVVGEQNCPAHGEDLCKEYHCEAATKACVLHDKLIPSEAADDQCHEYECNAETGEWEPHPAHDCDSKEARGCAEWSCDPHEGCLLSVRAGCCSDFDKNCTGCIGTLGCFYDPSGDLCEAMELSLEESRVMPNGTNNWGEHACPSGRSDGGGDNTTAIVAGVVSAVASVGAVAGAAAGLAAWRKVKKRRLVSAANALEPISITSASINPVFEAATTELENPIFHKQ
ncbi:hypothetical protein QOT17_005217 [Balamuthia mandrillaris]